MRMNEACLKMLLDPTLWLWATAFTVVSIGGGALIGWYKGRMTVGIIWAAVLGPLGWIIVAFFKSNLAACPECSKGNRPGARTCRHCAVDLEQATARSARSRLRGAKNDSR
ncbi:MAG TPA: hypothetical protein VFN25_12970 [Dokdonella sp.]|uniref:hypothetical protein n=1 Tax=Dokdonella sp. TaxID=2291710 RepID=UPI002D7FEBD8|nr:hypothetical protein [Dokdonella sp.]HET9033799.1 hypothetical protein [Dokdonella sp.]